MNKAKTETLTLGRIAKIYKVRVIILLSWIEAYEALNKELQDHLIKTKKGGQKLLPPALVEKIFNTIGEV